MMPPPPPTSADCITRTYTLILVLRQFTREEPDYSRHGVDHSAALSQHPHDDLQAETDPRRLVNRIHGSLRAHGAPLVPTRVFRPNRIFMCLMAATSVGTSLCVVSRKPITLSKCCMSLLLTMEYT